MDLIDSVATSSVSLEEYLAHPGLSRSDLLVLATQTPADFVWRRQNPKAATPAMNLGTAVHTASLEPQSWYSVVASNRPDLSGITTKDGKPAKNPAATAEGREILEQWRAENEGKIELSEDDAARALALGELVRSHPAMVRLLDGALIEQSYFWEEQINGQAVQVKTRPDLESRARGMSVDIKTTRDLGERHLRYAIEDHGYAMQAAMIRRATGAQAHLLVWVLTDPSQRPEVVVQQLPTEWIDRGERQYLDALSTYVECEQAEEWPGLPKVVEKLSMPSYLQEADAPSAVAV